MSYFCMLFRLCILTAIICIHLNSECFNGQFNFLKLLSPVILICIVWCTHCAQSSGYKWYKFNQIKFYNWYSVHTFCQYAPSNILGIHYVICINQSGVLRTVLLCIVLMRWTILFLKPWNACVMDHLFCGDSFSPLPGI